MNKEIKNLYKAIAVVFVNSEQGPDDISDSEKKRCNAKKRACRAAHAVWSNSVYEEYGECQDQALVDNFENAGDDVSAEDAVCGYARDMCNCEMQMRGEQCWILKEINSCHSEDNEHGPPCRGRTNNSDCNNPPISSSGSCPIACNHCPPEYSEEIPCKWEPVMDICARHSYRIGEWMDAIKRLDEDSNPCTGILDACDKCDCKAEVAIRLKALFDNLCIYVNGIEGCDDGSWSWLDTGKAFCNSSPWYKGDFDLAACKAEAGCAVDKPGDISVVKPTQVVTKVKEVTL